MRRSTIGLRVAGDPGQVIAAVQAAIPPPFVPHRHDPALVRREDDVQEARHGEQCPVFVLNGVRRLADEFLERACLSFVTAPHSLVYEQEQALFEVRRGKSTEQGRVGVVHLVVVHFANDIFQHLDNHAFAAALVTSKYNGRCHFEPWFLDEVCHPAGDILCR